MSSQENRLPWEQSSPEPTVSAGAGTEPSPPRPGSVGRDRGPDCPVERAASEDVISGSDVDLIHVAYGFLTRESRCAVCSRQLIDRIRITLHHFPPTDGSWIASVSCRCKGWRHHRNNAAVWVGQDGLHLGKFHGACSGS